MKKKKKIWDKTKAFLAPAVNGATWLGMGTARKPKQGVKLGKTLQRAVSSPEQKWTSSGQSRSTEIATNAQHTDN